MASKKTLAFIAFLVALSVICCLLAHLCFFKFKSSPPVFSPPDPDAKKYPTVIIDAGHGGEDGGAIGKNGVYEKELNLKIALELQTMLEQMGFNTRLTRTDDTLLYDKSADYQGHKKALDMAARLAICEEYDDAIFVSIHMNSFPQEKYSGIQVYYSENDERSRALADMIQYVAVQNLQPDNTRKTKPSEGNIYLLDKAKHPAVLVECGFLSNEQECRLLCSDEYRSRLCMALCSAIVNYFESYGNNS